MVKPAIVAVGYNRPAGMKRLLKSIGKAKFNDTDITLIVSIDESNMSNEVEKVAQEFEWNYGKKEIRRFPERQGLRKHIVQCGDYSEKYGAVIILEDDLVVAEDFYSYVCEAHEAYNENEKISGIALYSFRSNQFTHFTFTPMPSIHDVYLGDMVVTWGQSWNLKQWRSFKEWYLEHEGKLPLENVNIPRDISGWTRSWGRYFASYMADRNLSYIYPYIARSTCFSDFGEHNKTALPLTFVQVPLMNGCPKEYSFGAYEELVHYDCFYERVLSENDVITGISGNEICMDLNNMKTSAGGKKYVATNSELPYKKIASFGLTLRPISLNLFHEISGDQLHLYQLNEGTTLIRPWCGNRPKYQANHRRLKYEFQDASWRVMWFYAPREFWSRLKDKFAEKFKK